MILILVKFPIREDKLDEWRDLSRFYAESVTAEPGNVFFEFSESVLEPNTFVCIEGFRDDAAGKEHMAQQHVTRFMAEMPDIVAAQPQIIYVDSDEVSDFGPMGEIQPRSA
ncbi:putative quinol monooxygenase [Terracoccus luteus]|uniref:Quinol monooxygenase YgiN n=1 Tax=Terracoccus luteus TaxID=53356 RepID=A0A495XYU9_9MICO|nr:putative quinol monooxygenase [Terracoccus luteus]MBB2988150.1 quinol monooxygenase YgiN [Terracoccus luteus]MCP2173785.1 quinol monooxygenase YgiN [Terracoccus luteus]RKT77896.1 quinol monooxygenase YgiN [Terracoccus luteus]